MSVIDQINKLLGKNASSASARGDAAVPDDLSPAGDSAQLSTAEFPDSEAAKGPAPVDESSAALAGDVLVLPVLGARTTVQHQRILAIMLGLSLVVLTAVTFYSLNQADKVAQQVAATGQSLMQSQRLAKSVSQALVGSPTGFCGSEVRVQTCWPKPCVASKTGTRPNAAGLGSAQAEMGDVEKAVPLIDRAEKNANTVMSQQKILTQVGTALRTINRQSSDLLEIAETITSLTLQQNAAASEISASGQLVMLTQRIGKSANEFLTMEGVSPEAVFLLGKDLNSFKEIGQGLARRQP
jgi:twitching motility protein PilJ